MGVESHGASVRVWGQQRRAKASALEAITARHRDRDAAMEAAFATGQYTLAQIAEHFGAQHYSTVSRAVRGIERARRRRNRSGLVREGHPSRSLDGSL